MYSSRPRFLQVKAFFIFAFVILSLILRTGMGTASATHTKIKLTEEFTLSRCHDGQMISIHCGKTPSVVFDTANRLWAVFELNNVVLVSYSVDYGTSFSKPVAVNSQPEEIFTNGENRPKIALGNNGEIYVSWTKKTPAPYAGDIRFSRSVDQGKSFSPVTTINDDGLLTSHRFDSLSVSKDGTIYISWLDKRDKVKEKRRAKSHAGDHKKVKFKAGAAIYYSVSANHGKSFEKNIKIGDSTCVCCRIAMTPTNDGQMAVFWRHIFGNNTRDHAFSIINNKSVSLSIQRATFDNWNIDACPHHGPSMLQDSQDTFHMTWFTASENRKGIFYGQYDSSHKVMQKVTNLSNRASASHPFIGGNKKEMTIVWKEFNGEETLLYSRHSIDGGQHWAAPVSIMGTLGDSDHPLLTAQGEKQWLSWHTKNEGLRLLQLN